MTDAEIIEVAEHLRLIVAHQKIIKDLNRQVLRHAEQIKSSRDEITRIRDAAHRRESKPFGCSAGCRAADCGGGCSQ